MASKDFDIIVFGASGITGIVVVQELINNVNDYNSNVKWAVAGRDRNKLKLCLKESFTRSKIANKENAEDKIEIFVANCGDQKSLEEVTKRTRVLINCVGPFIDYGEIVVKSCLETNTDYVDVTGEPLFMEKIQLNYFNLAKDKNIHIISACGLDSIPADIGVNYLKDQFKNGGLDSVETYISSITVNPKEKLVGNHTTWDCIIEGMTNVQELISIRKNLFRTLFENVSKFRSNFRLQRKSFFKKDNGYCLPFPGSDRSVIKRSQFHNYLYNHERPVEIETYVTISSLKSLILMFIYGVMFSCLRPFKFGRSLLHQYPSFFTGGVFTKEGPTKEEDEAYGFEIMFEGKGWNSPLADALEQRITATDKKVKTRVYSIKGTYLATAICALQSAYVLLEERSKLPHPGGVWTPAIAFRNTSLIERLDKNGVHFEVLSSE